MLLYETYPSDVDNLGSFYAREGYGAICCDEEYLKDKFGDYEVIMGDIYEKQGVIITDYLADSMIKTSIYVSSYDDLIYRYYFSATSGGYSYIKAIIKTDYKNELKEYLEKAEKNNGKMTNKDKASSDEDFANFCRIIETKYGLAYTFSNDFLENNISKDSLGWIPMRYVNLEYNGVESNTVYSVSAEVLLTASTAHTLIVFVPAARPFTFALNSPSEATVCSSP